MTQHDHGTTFTSAPFATLRLRARTRASFLAALGLCACASAPQQKPPEAPHAAPAPEPERQAWPEPPPEEQVVHGEFQTSASAVEPSGKFLLAVRFDISPEYRISWTNPGDVGKGTEVVFQVPEGFSVGKVQFPAPKRFDLPGKLVAYGYEGGTAVFAEVTAPAHLAENEVYRFDVKASWLACKDDCATEELNAWFELAGARKAPEPKLPGALEHYFSALPKAFDDLPDAHGEWKKGNAKRPALTLEARDVQWHDFFPGDPEQPKLVGVKPSGHALQLKFQGKASDKPLRGLAVGEVDGRTAFYDVNLPWPSE
jgi:hypothetical protein